MARSLMNEIPMQVTVWTNKSNEACATVWDKDKAQYSIAFKTVEQRNKFIKKNKLRRMLDR